MHRHKMLKKGGIFTIDAMLALIVAGTILISSIILFGQDSRKFYSISDSGVLAYDSLLSLEESGTFPDAVLENSSSDIALFLNNLPRQFCANLSIFTASGNIAMTAVRQNCLGSDESVIARNIFVAGNSGIYYSEMRIWYRQ